MPTRITEHSATCIDHIFVRHPQKQIHTPVNAGIFYCDISDHLPCFISFKLIKTDTVPKRPKVRLFGETNCSNFKNRMENFVWNDMIKKSSNPYDDFIKNIKTFFISSFPLVTLSRKRSHDKPWVSTNLKISISKNHKLYKKKITNPSQENVSMYTKYNRILRKCLKEAERIYYNQLFEDKKILQLIHGKHLDP